MMPSLPTPEAARAGWTFGRETPVDGDRLAFALWQDRKFKRFFALLQEFGYPSLDPSVSQTPAGVSIAGPSTTATAPAGHHRRDPS